MADFEPRIDVNPWLNDVSDALKGDLVEPEQIAS